MAFFAVLGMIVASFLLQFRVGLDVVHGIEALESGAGIDSFFEAAGGRDGLVGRIDHVFELFVFFLREHEDLYLIGLRGARWVSGGAGGSSSAEASIVIEDVIFPQA
jgi:hypothetical protein